MKHAFHTEDLDTAIRDRLADALRESLVEVLATTPPSDLVQALNGSED